MYAFTPVVEDYIAVDKRLSTVRFSLCMQRDRLVRQHQRSLPWAQHSRSCRALLCLSEAVLQSELDHARVHASGSDLSEVARGEIRQSVNGALAIVRVGELRVVKGVKKFGSELDRLSLADAGRLQNRKIEIELAGSADDAVPAVAK